MREPDFWWRDGSVAATLLSPAAAVYAAVADRRMKQDGAFAAVPVICVGNLTLGGAGKTPTALRVAALLKDAGARPAFLSRGYGGTLAGPVRVDPQRHGVTEVGDEPLLLARAAPTIVSQDRVEGARFAAEGGADVIVMDDGFQNPALRKDASLIVIDGARGIGNAQVFPAGPLRASLATQIERTDALLVVGDGASAEPVVQAVAARGKSVFRAALRADQSALDSLADIPVFAFAGIAHPDKFFATLERAGVSVPRRRAFPDHHGFTAAEAKALLEEAGAEGLTLVTTEKDRVRLSGDPMLDALAGATRILPVTLAVNEENVFASWLLDVLKAARQRRCG